MTHSLDLRGELLGPLLRDTARSFYLTLRMLPRAVRAQVGTAYLLARAADTLADSQALPREKRLESLLQFRRQFERKPIAAEIAAIQREGRTQLQASRAGEARLLERLGDCFTLYQSFEPFDRRLVAEVVTTLTAGMEKDLRRFHCGDPADVEPRALQTDAELDEYTYLVAGCVGRFWTQICVAHLPALRRWDVGEMSEKGVRFGKGLQLTNILRDLPRDLRAGRCYLPAERLRQIGLAPGDLLQNSSLPRLRPLLHEYLDRALEHLDAGWEYTMSVPRRLPRLRLACIWPIWVGLQTLAKIRHRPDLLNEQVTIKVSREEIYKLMARSAALTWSDSALARRYLKLRQEVAGGHRSPED